MKVHTVKLIHSKGFFSAHFSQTKFLCRTVRFQHFSSCVTNASVLLLEHVSINSQIEIYNGSFFPQCFPRISSVVCVTARTFRDCRKTSCCVFTFTSRAAKQKICAALGIACLIRNSRWHWSSKASAELAAQPRNLYLLLRFVMNTSQINYTFILPLFLLHGYIRVIVHIFLRSISSSTLIVQ